MSLFQSVWIYGIPVVWVIAFSLIYVHNQSARDYAEQQVIALLLCCFWPFLLALSLFILTVLGTCKVMQLSMVGLTKLLNVITNKR